MGEYVNTKTVIAFVLGVILAAYVKSLIGQAKTKATGA